MGSTLRVPGSRTSTEVSNRTKMKSSTFPYSVVFDSIVAPGPFESTGRFGFDSDILFSVSFFYLFGLVSGFVGDRRMGPVVFAFHFVANEC